MKKISSLALLMLLIVTGISAKEYQVSSPDGKIKVNVSVDKEIKYSVQFGNIRVIDPSAISFTFRQAPRLAMNLRLYQIKLLQSMKPGNPY